MFSLRSCYTYMDNFDDKYFPLSFGVLLRSRQPIWSLKFYFLITPSKVKIVQSSGLCVSVLTCKMKQLGNDDIITNICVSPVSVISMRQQQWQTTGLYILHSTAIPCARKVVR